MCKKNYWTACAGAVEVGFRAIQVIQMQAGVGEGFVKENCWEILSLTNFWDFELKTVVWDLKIEANFMIFWIFLFVKFKTV
jgi:hypothetical protein